jgi:hypothetical protein
MKGVNIMNLSENRNDLNNHRSYQMVRVRIGLVLLIIGLGVFILGVNPAWFGLDRSSILGFVQISVFLIGLAMICLGGYMTMNALWNGRQKSIIADIGLRLVSTGYVIAVASGFADFLGFGSHPLPSIPYFGHWQSIGMMVAEIIILIGFIMMIPFNMNKEEDVP